jgi:hypothetical protein
MGTPSPSPWDLTHSRQDWMGQGRVALAPVIPASESALGLRPRRALSSAQVLPAYIQPKRRRCEASPTTSPHAGAKMRIRANLR